jgi:peptidoglycan/xylan/chitin deacetylase (PgdA/CDA1 family)
VITVPVLGYHSIGDRQQADSRRWSVSPGDFDEQMAMVRERGHTTLSVDEYVSLLTQRSPLPRLPVLVTFDDGYEDLVSNALPILQRYDITATAYVITSRIGAAPMPDGETFLDWDQLDHLQRHGVQIGSHSRTHRALDCLPRSELHEEILLSKRSLEDRLGTAVTSFAYPYGYHSDTVRRAVQLAGYASACAVKNALSHSRDDVFAIARVLIERDTGVAGLAKLLAGQGWSPAWKGERLRTRGWRAYRRLRYRLDRIPRQIGRPTMRAAAPRSPAKPRS